MASSETYPYPGLATIGDIALSIIIDARIVRYRFYRLRIDSKRASPYKGSLSPIIIGASSVSYTLNINNFITINHIKKLLVI